MKLIVSLKLGLNMKSVRIIEVMNAHEVTTIHQSFL